MIKSATNHLTRSAARSFRLAAIGVLLPAVGASADFSYSFGFGAPGTIQTVGSASYNQRYLLTNADDQAGAMWYNVTQRVDTGFTTTFRFQIDPGSIAGDGFAFVLQDSSDGINALGGGGSALGYGQGTVAGQPRSMNRSIAVEFDTFTFGAPFEHPAPHVAIHTQGSGPNDNNDSAALAWAELAQVGVDILDGQAHTAVVQYLPPDGMNPGRMEVYIDNVFIVSADVDLTDIGGTDITNAGYMYAGFTAATGLADSTHGITDWAFNDDTGDCAPPYWHVIGWGGCGIGCFADVGWQVVGTNPMTYRWFKDNTEITNDQSGRIRGLNTMQLTIDQFGYSDVGYYRGEAENACGSTVSITVFLGECIADVDDGSGTGARDGGVGIEDLIYYLTQYETGSLPADVDDGNGSGFPDGGVGIEDLLFYLTRYDSGC